jgi:hypothetical protein
LKKVPFYANLIQDQERGEVEEDVLFYFQIYFFLNNFFFFFQMRKQIDILLKAELGSYLFF